MLRGSDPKIKMARLWRKKLTANEATSNVSGGAPRNGRKATRSRSNASTTATRTTGRMRRTSEPADTMASV